MAKKQRKFADDGWAVWVEGDDTSTVYLNDWLNPKGKSYMDLAIRVRGVKASKSLSVYAPFPLTREEIEDVSLLFQNTKILQATFSTACIIDFQKNAHTSEIAYNGKTVDIVHISTLDYQVTQLSGGTLIRIDLTALSSVGAQAQAVRTSGSMAQGEHWAELGALPVENGVLCTALSPNSMTTFIVDQAAL